MFFGPLQMAGGQLGVICNTLFPEWTVRILLMMTLTFSLYVTLGKTIEKLKADFAARRARRAVKYEVVPEASADEMGTSPMVSTQPDGPVIGITDATVSARNGNDFVSSSFAIPVADSAAAGKADAVARFMEEDAKIPYLKYVAIGVLWVSTTVLMLLTGGKSGPGLLDLEVCGGPYWSLWILTMLIELAFGTFFAIGAGKAQAARDKVDYPWVTGDLRWTPKLTVLYGLVAVSAGLIGGMVGIGGAMVTGPLLLSLKLHPSVVAAVNGTTVFLTSASSTIAFFVSGRISVSYAVFLGSLCFCGALFGKFGLDGLSKKYGLNSAIVVILSAFLVISTVLVFFQTILKWSTGGFSWGVFGDYCVAPVICGDNVCPVNAATPTLFGLRY